VTLEARYLALAAMEHSPGLCPAVLGNSLLQAVHQVLKEPLKGVSCLSPLPRSSRPLLRPLVLPTILVLLFVSVELVICALRAEI
jgi:hypothetical protein